MSEKKPDQSSLSSRGGARLQHVVVHTYGSPAEIAFDDVLVFGQELAALRHIIGKPDWRYVAVAHGQSVADALKAGS